MENATNNLVSVKDCDLDENINNFLYEHFKNVTQSQWNDWKWQLKNSITDIETLENFFTVLPEEIMNISKDKQLPLRITPYYLSLIDKNNSSDPIRKCVVPTIDELMVSGDELCDSLGEVEDSPVPNIVHRYPDRVLFLIAKSCGVYCRYCTRSHMVEKENQFLFNNKFEAAFKYIESHEEIRDVILSGGDPLTLSDESLDYFLRRLRNIPHVEIIRIGTKVPAVLPQRITDDLINILKKYHPLYMSLHFTHPNEITKESKEACEKLANAGIVLGSQTVLLRGVNDDAETLKELYHKLLLIRVRPYYLYMMDKILGGSHFSTSVKEGLEIISQLRGWTSGYAIPHFIIDTHEGKVAILPESIQKENDGSYTLTSFKGKKIKYKDRSFL